MMQVCQELQQQAAGANVAMEAGLQPETFSSEIGESQAPVAPFDTRAGQGPPSNKTKNIVYKGNNNDQYLPSLILSDECCLQVWFS